MCWIPLHASRVVTAYIKRKVLIIYLLQYAPKLLLPFELASVCTSFLSIVDRQVSPAGGKVQLRKPPIVNTHSCLTPIRARNSKSSS